MFFEPTYKSIHFYTSKSLGQSWRDFLLVQRHSDLTFLTTFDSNPAGIRIDSSSLFHYFFFWGMDGIYNFGIFQSKLMSLKTSCSFTRKQHTEPLSVHCHQYFLSRLPPQSSPQIRKEWSSKYVGNINNEENWYLCPTFSQFRPRKNITLIIPFRPAI